MDGIIARVICMRYTHKRRKGVCKRAGLHTGKQGGRKKYVREKNVGLATPVPGWALDHRPYRPYLHHDSSTPLNNLSFSLATLVPSLLSQNGLPETQETLAIFSACGDLTHGIRRCSGIAHSRVQFHESYSNPASHHQDSTQSV